MPTYVYTIFFVVVCLSILAGTPSKERLIGLLIFPFLFSLLALTNYTTQIIYFELNRFVYIGYALFGFLIGIRLGWYLVRSYSIQTISYFSSKWESSLNIKKSQKDQIRKSLFDKVLIPADKKISFLILLIFFFVFCIHYQVAVHVSLIRSEWFRVGYAGTHGMIVGVLWGRALGIVMSYFRG